MIDHSGHDMGGSADSKLSEAQAAFKAANDKMHAGMADIPEDADIAFMQGMLAHHQGAVEMSEVALKYARDEQARDLAARVIAAQKEEIAEMGSLAERTRRAISAKRQHGTDRRVHRTSKSRSRWQRRWGRALCAG